VNPPYGIWDTRANFRIRFSPFVWDTPTNAVDHLVQNQGVGTLNRRVTTWFMAQSPGCPANISQGLRAYQTLSAQKTASWPRAKSKERESDDVLGYLQDARVVSRLQHQFLYLMADERKHPEPMH
jgi:hypothetical protein